MRYSQKTQPWITTLSVGLIVLLYFLIVWLLVGEINLSNNFYIVPVNGELWHGKITSENIDKIWSSQFIKWTDVKYEELQDCIDNGKVMSIHSIMCVFNPIVLAYIFGGIAISIIYPFIFKLLKWGNYDLIPFSVTTAITCSIFFISALIPCWANVNDFWRELLRLFISVICGIITFIFINWIVNKFYITSDNAQALANELKANKQYEDRYNNDLKKLVDNYNKEDHDYVDLDNLGKKK